MERNYFDKWVNGTIHITEKEKRKWRGKGIMMQNSIKYVIFVYLICLVCVKTITKFPVIFPRFRNRKYGKLTRSVKHRKGMIEGNNWEFVHINWPFPKRWRSEPNEEFPQFLSFHSSLEW
jgi:hypothetical protein